MPLTLPSVSLVPFVSLAGFWRVSWAGFLRYPTSTAAATTVVQSPFLSPTAVWVTF